jgi:hypothetical protein
LHRGELWFQKSRGQAIIAIELHIVKRSSDSVPSGHGRRFQALHVRHGGDDHVPTAHGTADQNDFQLDRCPHSNLLRAEKIDARRAKVASNQGDGKFLRDVVDAAQLQREFQCSARILAVFRVNVHCVCRNAREAPGLRFRSKGQYAKGGNARLVSYRLRRRGSDRLPCFRNSACRHRFDWSCAIRRTHLAPRDAASPPQTLRNRPGLMESPVSRPHRRGLLKCH